MQRGIPFESSAPTHNALMCEVALTFWLLKCCLISISFLNHLCGKLVLWFSLCFFHLSTLYVKNENCMVEGKPFCCDDSFDELIDEKFSFNLVNAAFHVRHQV